MRISRLMAIGTLLAIGGCGGGGQSSSIPSGNTLTVGNATISFSGTPQPLVQTANGSTSSVALAGANFTSFLYNPPKDVDRLPIAFVSQNVVYLYDSNGIRQVTAAGMYVNYASFTPLGQLLLQGYDFVSKSDQLFLINPDGSGLKRLTNAANIFSDTQAEMSPDGTRIVFDAKPSGKIYYCNASGGGEAVSLRSGTSPSWSPDGTKIVYSNSSGVVVTGSSAPAATDEANISDLGSNPRWSPNGSAVGSYYGNLMRTFDSGGSKILFGTAASNNVKPCFSADSKQIAFVDTNGIVAIAAWNMSNPKEIPNGLGLVTAVTWAPYLKPKYFLGSSGVVQASAAGFILSQCAGSFGSFFAFTATTPASASVTLASSGGGDQVFRVYADKITVFRYMNGYANSVVAATPPAGTSQMLVSVDPISGKVGLVAPFTASARPAAESRTGELFTVRGPFSAAYDATGKNLAPDGATRLTLNLKTGKLIDLR